MMYEKGKELNLLQAAAPTGAAATLAASLAAAALPAADTGVYRRDPLRGPQTELPAVGAPYPSQTTQQGGPPLSNPRRQTLHTQMPAFSCFAAAAAATAAVAAAAAAVVVVAVVATVAAIAAVGCCCRRCCYCCCCCCFCCFCCFRFCCCALARLKSLCRGGPPPRPPQVPH